MSVGGGVCQGSGDESADVGVPLAGNVIFPWLKIIIVLKLYDVIRL